jgi:hypothetical protein
MWDKGLADEIESMFSALLVPETDGLRREGSRTGDRRAPGEGEDVSRKRARDAEYHAKRLKEDPEFLERRREQWRRSKARKKAA